MSFDISCDGGWVVRLIYRKWKTKRGGPRRRGAQRRIKKHVQSGGHSETELRGVTAYSVHTRSDVRHREDKEIHTTSPASHPVSICDARRTVMAPALIHQPILSPFLFSAFFFRSDLTLFKEIRAEQGSREQSHVPCAFVTDASPFLVIIIRHHV